MRIFRRIEFLLGSYKFLAPILKMRAGKTPVWVIDRAKKINKKDGTIEYELYKLNGKFPPPKFEDIYINDKGKDVFPKVMLDDGTFLPLVFNLEDTVFYQCKGCKIEFDNENSIVDHVNTCSKVKEMIQMRQPA